MSIPQTTKITTALKKSIGSSKKALQKIEEGSGDCSEILVHIDSAIGLLDSSRRQLILSSLQECLDENLPEQTRSKQRVINQFTKLLKSQK